MSGSKGLQVAENSVYQDSCFVNGLERKECPDHFHEAYVMTIRNSCKINHSTYPCRHSIYKIYGHTITKAQGQLPHSDQTSVSTIVLLLGPCKTSEFISVFRKVFHYFHPQDTHCFFSKNPFCCFLIRKLSEENW